MKGYNTTEGKSKCFVCVNTKDRIAKTAVRMAIKKDAKARIED